MPDRKMSIPRDKTANYARLTVGEGEDKRRVIDNDDEVSRLMRGRATDDQLRELAVEHGLHDRYDGWGHLNRGQRRMNLGNALRHKLRREAEAKAKAGEKAAA